MKKVIILLISIISLFPAISAQEKSVTNPKSGLFKHFVWGADIGCSIDMSGNNMSTIDADAYFGYKNSFIRTLGVGATIHSALGNGNALIPVYVLFRSSFTTKPSLCFLDLRGGYSFNNIINNEQSGLFGSAGIGFNLAFSKSFNSHLILSYNFNELKPYTENEKTITLDHLHSISVRIGISF